ncbi:YbaB/EbfC family nucleoid-associated protein [Thermopetrobacter sp. TC1]|uniref:YbaB/EbfC family nucleoid-associated protein n=1 Tax=Thermopetrobacter sp. TC1 TaxID=1495045 RepID=UPI00057194C3|nr:YbaB/EbfC family nucleoid-associated protein [Thermopetrobacter sp. TC1]
MKDLGSLMRQVQEMQERMQRMQQELAEAEVEGTAGGGLVSVRLNGKGEMRGVRIDESLLKPEECEILEDLIVAAHNDAKAKMEALIAEKMKEATGDLPLPPGMNLPF